METATENKKRLTFSTELAYVVGMLLVALGCGMMEYADFGVSMIVAPAYLLHLKLHETFSFFTFGMAEYTLQAALVIVTAIAMRKFKLYYLFSFVTAVLYGFTLDGVMALIALLGEHTLAMQIIFFVLGILLTAAGVAMYFKTYLSPEVYELMVKELSGKTKIEIHKFKTGFDITMCIIGVILSFAFFGFGNFEGVKWGTIVCALANGFVISLFSKLYDKIFDFKDTLPLRKFFE